MTSYSEYSADLQDWFKENVGEDFLEYRRQTNNLLQEENKLMEIVKLIGSDVLPDDQKLVIEIARLIRVGFLQQNAFHAEDTFVPLEKQKLMMKVILHLYQKSRQLIAASVPISSIMQSGLFDKLVKIKYDVPNDKLDLFDDYIAEIDNTVAEIINN
jgi:V/A-type H+-transporting ATPase subunit A